MVNTRLSVLISQRALLLQIDRGTRGNCRTLREFLRLNNMTDAQAARRIGVRSETLYSNSGDGRPTGTRDLLLS
jgi:hypothetical protein